MKIRYQFDLTRLIAISLLLALNLWIQPISLTHAGNASTAAAFYPLTIDPLLQQAYLKASNTNSGDGFGGSVAVSGDTVVIGAPGESSSASGVNGNQSDNSASYSGAAYVFTRSGTTWSQQAYLKASNTRAGDQFGFSVAVSGDTIVVGARYESSNAIGVNGDQNDHSALYSGAAYVFTRSGTTWSQQAYLKASNTGAWDNFGGSVAVSGDTIVVGAGFEASSATGVDGNQGDNSAADAGAAYVFTRSGTTWSQQAYLKASNTGARDQFGTSVAVSGDTILVGAWGEASNGTGVNGNQNDNSADRSGAAYVFTRSGTTWSQQAYLKASNTKYYDRFGEAVAVSGDTVVVGAWGEASNAIGVNGNQLDDSAPHAGAAYVFTRSGTIWSQQAYLKASNTGASDQFGISVAVSGDTVVVGANYESSSATGVNGNQFDDSAPYAGATYVFTRSGTTWSQQAYLKASNTGASDQFGISVAVSDDTVVVGAEYEESGATGVNGNQSDNSAWAAGAAYVFSEPSVVHTTIIQVLDEGNNPVGGAQVWQNGVSVGTSSADGVLELNVTVGDKLVARKLVKTVPSIRSHHNQGAASDWAYHLYITSLSIPAADEPAPAIVTNPMVPQTLTLRKDNTLIGFNIVVCVEWDANAEYLENLRRGFELASAALYDVSNGQMLFERVTIFDNNQAMGSADYQIRASNKITPYVNAVGGLTSAPDKYIATGRYFVRSTLSDLGHWDLPANYRTFVHEFGHYGLYLYDSYFTYASSGWHRFDAYCTSPEIRTNQTQELNATLMDWGFNATEFSARGVPGAWYPVYCTQTEQFRKTGESDWETIKRKYKSPLPELWTLKTPINYQQIVTGPNTIPLQEWSKVVLDQDVQTGTCEPAPVIQVVNLYGTPTGGVKVVLQRGNRLIDEGETDRQGNISLWGAVPGDRATYGIPWQMLGTQRVAATATSLIATQIVSCASGRQTSAASVAAEGTFVTLEPAAFNLEIKISPSANPQQAALQVKASKTLAGEPQVVWMQNGASSMETPTLSYVPIAQAYQGVIPLANGLPTEGVIYVNAVDPQQHAVHTSRRVLLAQATPSDEQTIISSDGLAELFIPANSVQGSGQIGLQEQPIAGQPPSGLELLSGPYAIQPASGITQTGPINLTLHCLDVGAGNRKVDPSSSRIFSWDGLQWAPVTSTVGGEAQYVSAQVLISGTTYAVFGRWLQQVYLPLIMKN